MSRSVTNDSIARACVGLPPDLAQSLHRYLRGHHIGSIGRPTSREAVARRIRGWLETRRAEEAGARAWLEMVGENERQAT